MKKWQIVVIISVLAAALIALGGVLFYKYYIVPKYLAPAVEKVSSYLEDEDVIDELYDQAERLHDDGVIEDDIYSEFIRAYKKRKNSSEEAARKILEAAGEDSEATETPGDSSVTARYASNRVGVEIIQSETGGEEGKSKSSYSSERTSDRIKAEDVVEAERVIEEANATPGPEAEDEGDEMEDAVSDAYDTLRKNMTGDEFSSFVSIMSKLDVDTLIDTAGSDIEELKDYMHSCLSDDEYSTIVNLGYKYAYLFMED